MAFYIEFVGREEDRVGRKLSNAVKENIGYLRHRCPRTENHSPGVRVEFPENTNVHPLRAWL